MDNKTEVDTLREDIDNIKKDTPLTPQDESLSEFLGEPIKDGKVIKEESDEEPKEEVKVEETPKEEKPAFDPNQLKEEIASEFDKRLEAIVGKLDATTEEKKDIKEELLKNAPWIKEGRDPSWKEAFDYMGEVNAKTLADNPDITDKITAKVLERLDSEVQEEEKKAKEAEELQGKQQEAITKSWDDEFKDLETTGKIPKLDTNNTKFEVIKHNYNGEIIEERVPQDPGRRARYEILKTMRDISQKNISEGKPALMSAKLAYYEHYSTRPTQPAGGDAPVFGARKGISQKSDSQFTYDDVRNTSFEDLLSTKV